MQKSKSNKIAQHQARSFRIRRKKKQSDEETPSHPLIQLQNTIGNQAVGKIIQAKLKIGQPGDKYEQEADHVAEQVINMPEPQVQRQQEDKEIQTKPIADQISPLIQQQPEDEEQSIQEQPTEENEELQMQEEEEEDLQQQPVEEEEDFQMQPEEEEETLQAKEGTSRKSSVSPKVQANINTMRGSGKPLPQSARNYFEPRFEVDFSGVRVHNDAKATETAQNVKAKAFTVGNNVVFGAGQYDPESSTGKKLLAHELTHVVQQSKSITHKVQCGENPATKEETNNAKQNDNEINGYVLTIPGPLGDMKIHTYSQLLDASNLYIYFLQNLILDIDKDFYISSKAIDLIEDIKAISPYLKQKGDEPISQFDYEQAKLYYSEIIKICDQVKNYKRQQEIRAERRAKAILREAKEQTRKLRIRILYSYRDIYMAGEEPRDIKVGETDFVGLAESVKDMLSAINDADANISGRAVTPLIPVLDKTLTVTKLITGWKVTSGLAAESQKGMRALQNALNLANSGLSVIGAGKFLPLFGYIGPLLDAIVMGWDRVVIQLQKKNRRWWEARDVMGEDLPHPYEEPGGKVVFEYMKSVFRAEEPLTSLPEEVLEFFEENEDMFNRAASEVMDSWDIPTKTSWIFFQSIDKNQLNEWIFYHKKMVWRLIYGRNMEIPAR